MLKSNEAAKRRNKMHSEAWKKPGKKMKKSEVLHTRPSYFEVQYVQLFYFYVNKL